MLTSYMNNGLFWIVLSIIIIFFVWAFSTGKKYDHIRGRMLNYDENYIPPDTLYDTPLYRKNKHVFVDRSIPSPRVATPKTDITSRVVSRKLDITPDIPADVFKGDTHPKRESKGEKTCRDVLEAIYGMPFKSIRPNWLKNPLTGKNLELDGYNDTLKIAFEYNGIQHYKSDHYFNKSLEDFYKQVERDNYKIDKCDELGIYLITIPYNVPIDNIEAYIKYYLPEAVEARENRLNQLKE